jgi:hypothetical protein|tara:strand:+ start:1204 stop:1389 length:186 start_codon:yes stop_codon:yes gene_type:complete
VYVYEFVVSFFGQLKGAIGSVHAIASEDINRFPTRKNYCVLTQALIVKIYAYVLVVILVWE